MLPKHRPPSHPGRIIAFGFLEELKMSPADLSDGTGLPQREIDQLLAGEIPCSPEHAILLSEVFDTDPDFWTALQSNHDLWFAQQCIDEARAAN